MKKSSVIGACVLAATLVLAVPLGVHTSLTALRDEANSSYYYDQTGFAIWGGMGNAEAAASNLRTVAEGYTDDSASLTGLVGDVEYAVEYSQNCWDGDEGLAEANQMMGQAAQDLYEELKNTQLSETDEKYPDQLLAQMESEQDKINRSSYNEDAREFNARLEKFPVNLLRGVAGVEPLATFDYE